MARGLASFGAAAFVGGLFSFVFGIALGIPNAIHTGVGGMVWNGGHYCFFGTILAAAGAGLFMFAVKQTRAN